MIEAIGILTFGVMIALFATQASAARRPMNAVVRSTVSFNGPLSRHPRP